MWIANRLPAIEAKMADMMKARTLYLNKLIPIAQPQLSQHMAALRKSELVACHSCGPVRCYYILRPTLVKKLVRLLLAEHPAKERDCTSIVREARQGWEQLEECGQAEGNGKSSRS